LALVWSAPLAANDGTRDHVRHHRFAWLANDPANTYDNATLAGIGDVAGALGYAVDPLYAGFDLNTQLSQCRAALQSHRYDGFFVGADDAVGIEPCVAEAHRARVPVVAIDLPIGPNPATVEPQVPGEVGASFIPASRWAKAVKQILPQACQGLDPCNVLYLAGDEALAFDKLGPSLTVFRPITANLAS
jgi:ribose transport system substrate-binding protein